MNECGVTLLQRKRTSADDTDNEQLLPMAVLLQSSFTSAEAYLVLDLGLLFTPAPLNNGRRGGVCRSALAIFLQLRIIYQCQDGSFHMQFPGQGCSHLQKKIKSCAK